MVLIFSGRPWSSLVDVFWGLHACERDHLRSFGLPSSHVQPLPQERLQSVVPSGCQLGPKNSKALCKALCPGGLIWGAGNGQMVLILYEYTVHGWMDTSHSNAQEVHLVLLVQTTNKLCFGMIADEGSIPVLCAIRRAKCCFCLQASRLLVFQQAISNRIRAINHIVPLTSFDYIKRKRTNWISQQTGEGLSCEDLIPETSAHPRFEIMFAEFPQLLDVWGAQNNSKND